jgi:hypothetical protein
LESLGNKRNSHEPNFREILAFEAQKVENELNSVKLAVSDIQNKVGLGDATYHQELRNNVDVMNEEHKRFQSDLYKILALMR